ncbi:hypothetical protein I3760_12G092800 [Carya illinoinensis]|nr:hypothetical protein I3760_12G092800 [Carya illinoinensis]
MAETEPNMIPAAGTKRIAVVTGANKGIRFGISKQLASNGIKVILTARDVQRGGEAAEKLQAAGYSDVFFHQLDVTDPASISSLANFISSQFGKLDILINNEGIAGSMVDPEFRKNHVLGLDEIIGEKAESVKKFVKQTYEHSKNCLQTNYYGMKLVSKELIPLLQLSNSARIVNVSSGLGQLQNAKKELGDVDELTEEKVDKGVEGFLEDVKENLVEIKGWPKVSMLIQEFLAKNYPNIPINTVSPGHTKTNLNDNTGVLSIEEAAKGPTMLALMPKGGPSGLFFEQTEVAAF